MSPFKFGGDFARVHYIVVWTNVYGGDGVGCTFVIGRNTEGFEGRENVRIFDPLSLVGYVFEVEYQSSCTMLAYGLA